MHPRAGQHPGRGGAVLPGVEVPGDRDRFRDLGHVGVVEHDDRRLAAEFQVDPLEVTRGRDRDLLARPHAAGDRHHLRHRVRDQRAAGVPVTAHHVEHAVRQELAHQLGHEQRADRRGVGRLEHHGVARRQRRRPLPDAHHHRVVPRRHRRAHPDRLAPDHRGVIGHVLAGRPPFEASCRPGEKPDLVDHRPDLLGLGER